MAESLADLREPPVVGRYYMVPTVQYRSSSMLIHWPVIGPRHEDSADLEFPHLHYHIDGRFLSPRRVAGLRSHYTQRYELETILAGHVISEPVDIETSDWAQSWWGRLPVKPILRRLRCWRASYRYPDIARELIAKRVGRDRIGERYGPIAEPILRSDGRKLCPHRKVDLSQFTPDEDGIVTCPLHGLRVRCGASQEALSCPTP